MSKNGTWRELNAVELADWYAAIWPDAHVVKGRDSHQLRRFLDEGRATPPQVLEGMLYRRYGSVPIFLGEADVWLMPDVLEQEARLVEWLTGQAIYDLAVYVELKDTGIANQQVEAVWQSARQALQVFMDEVLGQQARSPHYPAMKKKLAARQERVTA